MDLSQPIARGRTAEIYALPDGNVLKLFDRGCDREHASRECKALTWAARLGLPVPKAGRLLATEGRYGFTEERIEGPNGMSVIMDDVTKAEDEARKLAELHVLVNSCSGERMPDRRKVLKDRVLRNAELSLEERSTLVELIKSLPSGKAFLHGDFHPGNIIWSPDGPKIIDWIDASFGDPASDVARSLVLFGYPLHGDRDVSDPRHRFTETYLSEYRRLSGSCLERLDDWLLVTAAARMVEGAAKDDAVLREQVHAALRSE